MVVNDEINKDHPQFTDMEYRKRRDYIAAVSKSHILGKEIPILDYTKEENETWKKIYSRLGEYHSQVCTEKYLYHKNRLEKDLHIGEHIP